MSKLTIITACTRPENLVTIRKSIEPGLAIFDLVWMIVYDESKMVKGKDATDAPFIQSFWFGDTSSVCGNGQRNFALQQIKDGWVWVLDDDNIVHPNFFPLLNEMIEANVNAKAFLLPQQHRNGYVRPVSRDYVRETFIDQAQYVLDRGLIGERRYIMKYTADGEFIERLFAASPSVFHLGTEVMCYYNWLRSEAVG